MIELMLVLAVIALLATLATPLVTNSVQRAREATLRQNLSVTRQVLDDYYADTGRYPPALQTLVEERYLRHVPVDPITERNDTWVLVRREAPDGSQGIYDIHSGAAGLSRDGEPYQAW